MRRYLGYYFYLFLTWVFLALSSNHIALAAAKTNINEVTSLFDDHIGGKDKLLNDLKAQMDNSVFGIKAKNGFEIIEGFSGSESKVSELAGIRAIDLDSEGRRKRASTEYSFYDENELEPDYTKSGNRMHKEDAADIAKATGDILGNLIATLKDLNIDCKTIKGPVQKEPVFYIDIRRENQRNTEYDQFFCEEPRNKYRCRDELKVRCSDIGYVNGTLGNVQGNMHHSVRGDGFLTIGVNREKYFYNSWGSQQDFNFTFDVSNAAGIETFKLLTISWSDHVLVELNGHKIFGSNGVRTSLTMSTDPAHYRIGGDDERYFGTDRGDGRYVPANTKTYFDANPNAEARHYLRDGQNTLHIRLVYGKGGKIWTRLQYKEKRCNRWIEEWNERCILQ